MSFRSGLGCWRPDRTERRERSRPSHALWRNIPLRLSTKQRFAHVPSRATGSSRSGLTLLEVLLATGLGMVLFMAVYAALDQTSRLSMNGRVELERAQLIRALVQKLQIDLRATMFSPDLAMQETDTGDATSQSGIDTAGTTGEEEDTSTSNEDPAWTGSLGIRGDAAQLWIDLSQVRRNMQLAVVEAPSNTGPASGSDLQTVAYFLTGGTSNGNANLSATDTAATSPIAKPDLDGVGLARSQGDRAVLRSANDGSSQVLPGPVVVLAPEVNRLSLRYFDGQTWFTEWDSSSVGALPRAIEITLGFEPPPVSKGVYLSPQISSSTEVYRVVVAIPVSDPLPPEEQS
jgi:hypothetical protein